MWTMKTMRLNDDSLSNKQYASCIGTPDDTEVCPWSLL